MKKIILLVPLLMLTYQLTSAQTKEMDVKLVTQKYEKGELSITDFKSYSAEWREMIAEIGYPQMPYTEDTSEVYFGFITEFEGLTNEQIYSRANEWLALNIPDLKANTTFLDASVGKIIVQNQVTITPLKYKPAYRLPARIDYSCILRITVKDRKLRTEFISINIIMNYPEVSTAESYSSAYSRSYPIESFYPLSKHKRSDLKFTASMLQWTKNDIEKKIEDFTGFIADIENDYNF